MIGNAQGTTPYAVSINPALNPPSQLALGNLQISVQVQFLAVIEELIINVPGRLVGADRFRRRHPAAVSNGAAAARQPILRRRLDGRFRVNHRGLNQERNYVNASN